MVDLRFEKVLALPSPATPNTVYFVKATGDVTAAQYVTGTDGVPVLVGGSMPTPAPVFTTQPSLSPQYVVAGNPITITPGVVTGGSVTARSAMLGTTALTITNNTVTPMAAGTVTYQETATGAGGTTLSTQRTATVAAAPALGAPVYSQAMGATTSDGWYIMPALKNDGVARRIFVDSVNGNDSYNGLSPHVGFRPNGSGAFLQIDATASSGVPDSGYGPKKSLKAAFAALPKLNYTMLNPGVGHRLMLAEGGSFVDPGLSDDGLKAVDHYGESLTSPFAIHSYKPSDPWNNATYGKALGSLRPLVTLSADKFLSWGSFVDGSYGLVSNFVYSGLRFEGPTARIQSGMSWKFSPTDADNILLENIDFGSLRFVAENQSGDKSTAHWSKNIVIRRCLFDHGYDTVGLQPAIFSSYVLGYVVEDCVFNHCAWADDADARYTTGGAPSIFRHDIYHSGAGQAPMVYRRNLSIDAAATALSCRNNSFTYHNWIIDSPIALISAGLVSNINLEQPNGNWFEMHHNFVMGTSPMLGTSVIFSGQPVPGSTTVRVANNDFEFVSAGQPATTGRQPITIGSSVSSTIDNLAAALNAKTDAVTSRVTYFNYAGTELRQTAKKQGAPYTWTEAYGPNVLAPDPMFRGWGYAATNGVQGALMRDSLLVNSGYSQNTGNAPNAQGLFTGIGRNGATSYVEFKNNRLFDFGPNRETYQADRAVTTYTDNTYSQTSPKTNDDVYAALGYANKGAFIAVVVANFEQPWALRGLDVAARADFWNHDFTIPSVTPPVISAQGTVDKTAPKVGEMITFAPPVSNGTIVSATTYVDMHPIAGTGKDANTLVLQLEHQGKTISRIWAIASTTGGLPTYSLCEIPNRVAAAPGVQYSHIGIFIKRSADQTGNSSAFPRLYEVRLTGPSGAVPTGAWYGDQQRTSLTLINDGDPETFWEGNVSDNTVANPLPIFAPLTTPSILTSIGIKALGIRAPGDFYVKGYSSAPSGTGAGGAIILTVNGLQPSDWVRDGNNNVPEKVFNFA